MAQSGQYRILFPEGAETSRRETHDYLFAGLFRDRLRGTRILVVRFVDPELFVAWRLVRTVRRDFFDRVEIPLVLTGISAAAHRSAGLGSLTERRACLIAIFRSVGG